MTSQLESAGPRPAPFPVPPSRTPSNDTSVTLTPSDEHTNRDEHKSLSLLLSPSSTDSETPMNIWKEWGIWLAIVSSIICPFLDEGIIATAIPAITSEFGAIGDVGWYGSAYLMTMSAFQLIFGRLYSEFPAKPTFITSLFLFEAGSLICALSSTSNILIFGRALAGVGAAGLYSGVMALFVIALPKKQLPVYLGAMGTLYGFSAVLGPYIGGVITETERLGWRWCFWINMPVAVPPLIATWLFVKAPRLSLKEGEVRRSVWARLAGLDYIGMVLLIPGISCLLVAVDYGGTHGWEDKRTIVCFVVAGVLTPLFALSQWWKGEKALLPPRIISDKLVFSCCVFTSCIESCFMVMVYYMPMWFQSVQGATASESGMRYWAICISYCAVEIACGWVVSRMGYVQPFMLLGGILIAVGGGLLSTLEVASGPEKWITYLVIAGAGVGAATDMPSSAVQRLMSETDAPLGYATILFCQNLGPTMAVIVANSVFLQRLTSGIADAFGDELDAQTVLASGATELRKMVFPEQVPKLLEVYNYSLTRVFIILIVSGIVGLLSIIGLGLIRLPGHEKAIDGSDPEREAGGQEDKETSDTSSEERASQEEGKETPEIRRVYTI